MPGNYSSVHCSVEWCAKKKLPQSVLCGSLKFGSFDIANAIWECCGLTQLSGHRLDDVSELVLYGSLATCPSHLFDEQGIYMVTSATYNKELFFKAPTDLDYLQQLLFELANKYNWSLKAWAIFPNHYHFIAQSLHRQADARKAVSGHSTPKNYICLKI